MNIEFLLALRSQLEKAMQEQQGGKIHVSEGTSNEEPRKACATQQECLEKRVECLEKRLLELEGKSDKVPNIYRLNDYVREEIAKINNRFEEQDKDLEGLDKSILSLRDVIEVSIRLFKLAIDAKN